MRTLTLYIPGNLKIDRKDLAMPVAKQLWRMAAGRDKNCGS